MPPKKKPKTFSDSAETDSQKLEDKEDGQVVKRSADGSETYTLFYGNNTVFSNFYPSTFVVDGNEFNCTEQYFHYAKAVHFKDDEIAEQLLKSTSPREQKALGRKVKNYDEKVWGDVGPRAMKDGLKAKFEQNSEMKAALLQSVGTTLVEASPRDRKWGIGLGVHNPKAADRKQWRGQNLLGRILTEVRDELLSNSGDESNAPQGASACG